MSKIDVLYSAPLTAPDANPELDTTALLEKFRAVAGDEPTVGWRVTAYACDEDSEPSEPPLWRVTLEHDTDSARALRQRIRVAADPRLRLCPPPPVKPDAAEAASFSLPLPVSVPAILIGDEAAQRKRAASQGILTGIICSGVLGFFMPQGNAIRRMFDLRTPTSAVPVAILCLFFWGLVYGLNRRRRLGAIETLNHPDLLPAVVDGLKDLGVERLEEALRGRADQYSVVRYSPLLRRIWVTLEQWLIRPNLPNAHLVIEQQVISDREATQRSYNLLRIFVWATPVLGLIGTVVGISIAVGGFASFLSTNVDDVSKIKAGLVGVTGGLSFAFLITLEGLLSSLVLMLFTSGLQTREERLYAGIERDVTEGFLPELQRLSPEREPGAIATKADDWADAMALATVKVIRAVEVAGKRILAKWDEKHEVYVADLGGIGESVSHSVQDVATALATAQLRDSGLAGILSELDATIKELKPLLLNASPSSARRADRSPSEIAGPDGR